MRVLYFLIFSLIIPLHINANENKAYNDWLLFYPDPNTPNQSYMMHTIGEANADKPILSIVIGRVAGKINPVIDFQIPPQATSSKELRISFGIDKKTPYFLNIEGCNVDLCHAYGTMTDEIATIFENQETANIRFDLEDTRPVTIHFSLKGFKAAYQVFLENQ